MASEVKTARHTHVIKLIRKHPNSIFISTCCWLYIMNFNSRSKRHWPIIITQLQHTHTHTHTHTHSAEVLFIQVFQLPRVHLSVRKSQTHTLVLWRRKLSVFWTQCDLKSNESYSLLRPSLRKPNTQSTVQKYLHVEVCVILYQELLCSSVFDILCQHWCGTFWPYISHGLHWFVLSVVDHHF